MERYGNFAPAIRALSDGLNEVRPAWQDECAASFDSINENLERLALLLWAHAQNAETAYKAVKENYDADGVNEELYALTARIDAV